MAQVKAPGAAIAPENERVQVFFGKLTKKVPKSGGGSVAKSLNFIATCRKAVADKLNLVIATPAQKENKDGEKAYEVTGATNGKTVIVPDPLGAKTPKGGRVSYSIQVPTNATKKEIEAFLKTGGKAKSFTIKGGRKRTIS